MMYPFFCSRIQFEIFLRFTSNISGVFVFDNPDMTTYMASKKGGSGSTDALLRPPLRKSKSGSSLLKATLLHLVDSDNISRLSNTVPFVSVVAMVPELINPKWL